MVDASGRAAGGAAARWAEELAGWAVPAHILEAAPRRPFVFPSEMFAAPVLGPGAPSRSTTIAADAIGEGGVVLDVGCGGGAAAFALVPPATQLIGTDRQQDMTDLFARTAAERGISCSVVVGPWPEVADDVPKADVAVSHNVLYNVPDIVAFATELHRHARRRVVLEITEHHPQRSRSPLWKHFWGIDRPDGPTAALAADALREAGIPVQVEASTATERDQDRARSVETSFWCRQLCLPEEREPEVAELMRTIDFPTERVTIWWDTAHISLPRH